MEGNEPGINTFPHQDGCELGKRLKKGPVYEVMRLKALVPSDEAQGDGNNTFPHQDGCELGKRLKIGPVYKVIRLVSVMWPKAIGKSPYVLFTSVFI